MEIEQVYEKFRESGLSLCTDSRLVKPGDFFVALPGETFDGNQFASVALEKGARYAVVSKSLDESTLRARQLLRRDGLRHRALVTNVRAACAD